MTTTPRQWRQALPNPIRTALAISDAPLHAVAEGQPSALCGVTPRRGWSRSFGIATTGEDGGLRMPTLKRCGRCVERLERMRG